MKINAKFVIRELSGVTVLLPMGGEFHGIMAVSPVGARILELLQTENMTQQTLLDRLCEEYDAPREEICADAEEFLKNLRENKILLD